MPVRVEMIKGNRAVLQTYSDPLSSADLRDLKEKMEGEIFPSVTYKLHIIADFNGVKNLPGTILINGSSMLVKAHPNTGTMVCVSPNNFIQSMAKIFSSLTPKQTFKLVRSLDEAYSEIDQLLAQEG